LCVFGLRGMMQGGERAFVKKKYRVFVYAEGRHIGSFVAEDESQLDLARKIKRRIDCNVVPFDCRCGLCVEGRRTQWCMQKVKASC